MSGAAPDVACSVRHGSGARGFFGGALAAARPRRDLLGRAAARRRHGLRAGDCRGGAERVGSALRTLAAGPLGGPLRLGLGRPALVRRRRRSQRRRRGSRGLRSEAVRLVADGAGGAGRRGRLLRGPGRGRCAPGGLPTRGALGCGARRPGLARGPGPGPSAGHGAEPGAAHAAGSGPALAGLCGRALLGLGGFPASGGGQGAAGGPLVPRGRRARKCCATLAALRELRGLVGGPSGQSKRGPGLALGLVGEEPTTIAVSVRRPACAR
mmetsp:Transcript_1059/g.4360  ORF Transcript_1059/g.4360 Transcript_1059/m.4360 type:complete len:268 (-) Transcript_1059:566-1369(-)